MSLARSWSIALTGLDGQPIEVEAAISSGLPRTVLVGLPDAALYEARDRCRAAVASTRLGWPQQPVTINLVPATLPKAGSHYDLAIVAAVLAAAGVLPPGPLENRVLLGELGLDGRVRTVRGVLPAVLAAREAGFEAVVVPREQAREAALVDGIRVTAVGSLGELASVLTGGAAMSALPPEPAPDEPPRMLDLADVAGQLEGKWALEVAAAGRHHMFLHGPPGVGKTMLAARLPGILPQLGVGEALEVSAVHSLAGGGVLTSLLIRPPYADPHHSASLASIVGGGSRIARPGSISLAHRGVLFLDEAPQFEPRVLEALRTPLESGVVTLGRSVAQACYPARFQLVLAANPCPCGQAGTPGGGCGCSPLQIRRYSERLSGPILDRIDIVQQLHPIRKALLRRALAQSEPSAAVAERVAEARQRQRHRLSGTGFLTNGEISGSYLRGRLPLPRSVETLDDAVLRGRLSQRGVDKVLRLSWTLADLAGRDRPSKTDLHTALAMRSGETVAAA